MKNKTFQTRRTELKIYDLFEYIKVLVHSDKSKCFISVYKYKPGMTFFKMMIKFLQDTVSDSLSVLVSSFDMVQYKKFL